jgi:hypothetical protein
MSDREWRRIRVDWEELDDAFADSSPDHRYYLDRETGAVHFFSSYLESEEEKEDERAMTAEGRYVPIPHDRRLAPPQELREFVASLGDDPLRWKLESTLGERESYRNFEEAVSENPRALAAWQRFVKERIGPRIKSWLQEVAVEPLE